MKEKAKFTYPLLDDEGYPTEQWLRYIREFKPDENFGIIAFVYLLSEGWWMPERGHYLSKQYRGKREFILHTGGWSGNEGIIDAILSNINLTDIYMKYMKWRRGGHYYFEIPIDINKKFS
jgi:hypothetical protein